jgi:putative peptide zinc metalloprotease protein
MAATHSGQLAGRKQVRIRLRRNLHCTEQRSQGQTVYVLKDPVTLAYFRLDEGQHFVCGLMDGRHTLGEIQKAYEKKFRPQRLSLEELEGFAAQLLHGGLADNESPLAGQLLHRRAEQRRRAVFWGTVANVLAIRIPLFDPDRLLTRLVPAVRFFFTRWFLLLTVGLVLGALALVATHWSDFLARLPSYRELCTPRTLLCLWLAIGLVKILHELGHGRCCKAFGGTVPEMGVLLLLFFPALYVNVSDSWQLPSKWRRMAIGAAGIITEVLVAALAAFAWWASDQATALHDLCFGLMVVCSVNTVIVNGNPLLLFDGYFVLSDWLGIPNLAEESGRCLRSACLAGLGVPPAPGQPAARPRRGLLIAYALASLAYRWVVLALSLWLLYQFLKPYKLGPLAVALALAALASLLVRPVRALVAVARQQRRLPDMKPVRVALLAGLVVGAVVVVTLVPFRTTVRGLALIQVEPDHVRTVTVPEPGGFVGRLLVRDGQRVRAGEVLAVLSNPKLDIALRLNEADQGLRQRQQSALAAELADPGPEGDQGPAGLELARAELAALTHEQATLREQHDRLTLRAPCDGVVLGLQPAEVRGKWLEKGTELCRVGAAHALRAVFLAEPADHRRIACGSPAWVRVHGGGATTWPGVVTEVAEVDAARVPAALSHHAGGDVATEQDPVSRAEKPRHPNYLVSVRLQKTGGALHPGALGRVKIEAGSETLWARFRRYLATTFNWGL